jgi:hypothetical protein
VSTFRRKYRQVHATRRPEASLPSREDKNVSTDDDHLNFTRINDDEGSVAPGDGHVSSSAGEDKVDNVVTQLPNYKGLSEKVARFAPSVPQIQTPKSQEGELQVEEATPLIPKGEKTTTPVGKGADNSITSLPINKEQYDQLKAMYRE